MPDPLPHSTVSPDERISRFLVSPKWFNQRTNCVFGQAFKPRKPKPPSTTFRTSVYRIDGCTHTEIWSIGENYVTQKRKDGRPVLARADIQAQSIFAEQLAIEPVPDPHPRHADIVRWPDQPEKQLEKASVIALTAKLVPLPSPQA